MLNVQPVLSASMITAMEHLLSSHPVVGLGVDVAEPERMKRMRSRQKAVLSQAITEREQLWVDQASDPLRQLAACFAVKEAVFKALGTSWLESAVTWADVELLSPVSEPEARVVVGGECERQQQARLGQAWVVRLEEVDGQVMALALLLGRTAASA